MLIRTIADELNEKLTDADLTVTYDIPNDCLEIYDQSGCCVAAVPIAAQYISQCYFHLASMAELSDQEHRVIDKNVWKILATPASKLEAEEKYIVQPPQFNSSRGAQLLSTDGSGRVFFAAQKHGLKQSFTNSELQGIINQLSTVDGSTTWLASMILSYKKLVK